MFSESSRWTRLRPALLELMLSRFRHQVDQFKMFKVVDYIFDYLEASNTNKLNFSYYAPPNLSHNCMLLALYRLL